MRKRLYEIDHLPTDKAVRAVLKSKGRKELPQHPHGSEPTASMIDQQTRIGWFYFANLDSALD